MHAAGHQWWLRAVIPGLAYIGEGVVSSALAGAAASDQARLTWRLAAWAAAGLVYATHIGYEHFRLHNSPRSIALHVAMAVAVGAFSLAVAATVHSLLTAHYRPGHLIALVAWPAITAFPALLVALAVSAVLARLPRR
jgi:hypothetical protein